jgi:hypothetical protein
LKENAFIVQDMIGITGLASCTSSWCPFRVVDPDIANTAFQYAVNRKFERWVNGDIWFHHPQRHRHSTKTKSASKMTEGP